ncbi:Adenylosuccinate lyase [Pigmentiphaga humi]|uniref:Adenylosuccinate lyase n=1 Tax=Pigmentiphaga humi TaxID=2478468 RepID=A0A3P4B3F2_9BURK|nr:lyase family protein [Pigmentiphaga humi]VCU70827.1 Adenylosuccinate lyase [Pigmentiphaga humi]
MDEIFGERASVAIAMRIEAALAAAQASMGIIPKEAAAAIRAKADPAYAPEAVIRRHAAKVGHPLVALLGAWSEQLGEEAAPYLHYGATTPDIRLTMQIMQMRMAVERLGARMRAVEEELARLCRDHRATPMMGRTVGRHALPITFGLKAATWMLENRRNLDRLDGWLERTSAGVLAGAVGTYAALGDQGFEVERRTMAELGLGAPEPADWKGTRDKHAEWGSLLAITAKSMARMAQEIFLLQGDDFAELDEGNEEVGSSTMPHKSNPRKATAVIGLARQVCHESEVLLDWMVSIYERDQISNDSSLASIAHNMDRLLAAAHGLLAGLKVYPENMARNLGRTGGLIMAERVMFALGEHVGKHAAHTLVREAALEARSSGMPFAQALRGHPGIAPHLDCDRIAQLLDHRTYLGMAPQAVGRALDHIEARRAGERAAQGPRT